jgi:hypothetical protein
VAVGVACSSGASAPDQDNGELLQAPTGQGGDAGSDAAGGSGGSDPGGAGKSQGGTTSAGGAGAAQAGGGQAGQGQAGSGAAGQGQAGQEQGGAGGTAAAGDFGAPCTSDDACTSKICVETGHATSSSQVCSQKCDAAMGCPKDSHCATIDMEGPLCIPDRDSYCSECKKDTDCKNLGDRCATAMNGSTFCAPDCAFDGKCPSGAECKAPANAPAGVKVCMPLGGEACPCAPNRDKETRTCTKMSGSAVCMGTETCDGKSGTFVGCDAPTPSAEVCDGKDNDCNGKADDLPGATCSCSGPNCTILCNAGFTHYPSDLPDAAGCPCAADSGEPTKGATCATALGLSTLSDAGGGKTDLSISGTLSSDDDVDWFKIKIEDAAETAKNSTHVRITFDANPDNEFVFQVIRGEDCTKEATAPTLTSYDFCVDYQEAGPKGMTPCGAEDGKAHCDSNVGSVYLIGIKRSPMAAKKTCSKYTFKVVANAGTCDPSTFDACGAAQTNP